MYKSQSSTSAALMPIIAADSQSLSREMLRSKAPADLLISETDNSHARGGGGAAVRGTKPAARQRLACLSAEALPPSDLGVCYVRPPRLLHPTSERAMSDLHASLVRPAKPRRRSKQPNNKFWYNTAIPRGCGGECRPTHGGRMEI